MDFLDFNDISCEIRGSMYQGKLKMTDKGLSWKGSTSAKHKEEIAPEDVDLVGWQRLAGSWGIRLFDKAGQVRLFLYLL